MAMFLSRLKQILNLGAKSITANGTYTASSDGYDGYNQVTVNVPTVTPPSITPSNSSPATLTADNPVNPTASGYAIASYEEIDVPSAVYTHNIYPNMPTISRVGAMIGVEQMHFHTVDPSNSNPATISDGEIYRAGDAGKAVASITDVIPSSTPTSVSTDDVVHIQGSGVIVDSILTPPSITPSNSNPATLTADTPVNPTANGYAIESYDNITPSSAFPEEFTTDDIVRFRDTGVIVDSITSITPNNSDPPRLEAAKNYFSRSYGYAISNYASVTPSNSSPTSIGSGGIYKPSASGYIIKSYSQETPSDTSPALVSSGDIIRPRANGYLYATQQKQKIKTGTVTLSTNATTYVNIGFKPKYIGLIVYKDDTHFTISVYNENVSDSHTYRGTKNGSAVTCTSFALPTSSTTSNTSKILSIDSTGFTIDKASSTFGTTAKYFAIGEEPTGTLPPMNVTVHHGSSSASNYAVVDNIGYTKLKLVSSTATTSAGNQYAIDNGSFTPVSVGSTVSIPSTGQVKLYLNRTGENTAVWEFSN